MREKEKKCSDEQRCSSWILNLLDSIYEHAANGAGCGDSVIQTAADYLCRFDTREKAAKAVIRDHIVIAGCSGALSGLGGFAAMFVSLPANVMHVLRTQMRMVLCLAALGGYDIRTDEVKTAVYACFADISLQDYIIAKPIAAAIGKRIGAKAIEKIPFRVLTQINRAVGFRLLAKFGAKSACNLGKAIPLIGAAIGFGIDSVSTKAIGKHAYRNFIENVFDAGDKLGFDFSSDETVN